MNDAFFSSIFPPGSLESEILLTMFSFTTEGSTPSELLPKGPGALELEMMYADGALESSYLRQHGDLNAAYGE